MKQILIYALTFSVIVLPTLFFCVLAGKREKKTAVTREQMPLLFLLTKPFVELLDAGGVGTFFRKLFPGRSQELQKRLSFSGLKLTAGEIYCAELFLVVLFGVAAGCVTEMVVDEENRISIPVAGLIAAGIGGSLPGIRYSRSFFWAC